MKVEKRDIRRLEKMIDKMKEHIDVNDPVLVGARKLLMKLEAGQHETIVNALTSRKHHWINESRRLVIEEPGSHEQKDATHMYGVYIDAVDDMKDFLKEGN